MTALRILIILYTLGVLLTRLPAMLAQPMWADQDVFATLAIGWEHGEVPYRDHRCTNTPGGIYLAWLLGSLFGWSDRSVWLFEAVWLLVVLRVVLIGTRNRLSGWAIVAGIVSLQASWDFTQAGQRDWYAVGLVGLSVFRLRTDHWGVAIGTGLAFAAAVWLRPQAVLFLPAVFCLGVRLEWWLGFLGGLGLGAVPIAWTGAWQAAMAQIGEFGDTGIYAHGRTLWDRLDGTPLLTVRRGLLLLIGFSLMVRSEPTSDNRRIIRTLVAALVGAWAYAGVSPFRHEYLGQPFGVLLCVLAGWCVEVSMRNVPSRWRWPLIGLILATVIDPVPACCDTRHWLRSVRAAVSRPPRSYVSPGYHSPADIPEAATYNDPDRRAMIAYLRMRNRPVANWLGRPCAVNGPTGQPTPLPAESLQWLTIVGHDHADEFIAAALARPQTLVTCVMAELEGVPRFRPFADVLRRRGRLVERFGEFEVWEFP